MRVLSIHVDAINYKATTKTKIAESTETMKDSMGKCMVFFTCIEKLDEANPLKVVEKAKNCIIKMLGQVKEKT